MQLDKCLITVTVACILSLSSCNGPPASHQGSDDRYKFTTGYIGGRGSGSEPSYHFSMVQRDGEPPWLIVAEPFDFEDNRLAKRWSTASTAVTIDGETYTPRPGTCIVVLQADGRSMRRALETSGNQTLQRLATGVSAVSSDEIASLLPSFEGAEQPHVLDPAAGSDSDGEPSLLAK